MPIILHLETATEVCSVAISQDTQILASQHSTEAYTHSAQLTLLIQACLATAHIELKAIDAVALSQGPGSYTALRVGSSTAKGICYALDKPLIAVDTLQAMALASVESLDKGLIYAPMIDARRMEVYTALFDSTGKHLQATEAKIVDEQAYAEYWQAEQKIVFSGNGSEKCRPVLPVAYALFREIPMEAKHLLPLALNAWTDKQFVDTAYFSPEYFKSPNITKPKKIW